MKFCTKNLISLRSHLVADGAKSSFQGFVENALEKTRQFFRVFFKNDTEVANSRFRYQYRLPFEFPLKTAQQTLPKKSSFISLRPGFIQKVTSRWATNSLAATLTKQAKGRLLQGGSGPILCFVGFTLAKKPSLLTDEEELEGVSYEIREAFSQVPWQKFQINKNNEMKKEFNFEDLRIGEMVAKGCNAAVYSACWKNIEQDSKDKMRENTWISEKNIDSLTPQKLIMPHSEGEIKDSLMNSSENMVHEKNALFSTGNLEPFDMAVKVMFNYSAESNAFAIWRAMYKETLPVVTNFSFNPHFNQKTKKKKHLPPHPNIVEMYFAFADQLPLLPGASLNYPQALPMRLSSDGCGRNMTLFLVMKRYHCSLKDYLKTHKPTVSSSLLLFTQLLEALVHMLQNNVAHRDLKTDNILLDISHGLSSPILAVTDFGCCLEDLKLPYQTDDVDKGGNTALMAPEIVNAEAGPFSVIDYSRSDLWTAGTLAYEIFGGTNPFYSSSSSLKAASYAAADLPPLPPQTPAVVQKLVRDMLHHDPTLRPRQNLAATVCQLLLHAPPELLTGPCSKKTYLKVFDWMFQMAAKTYLQATIQPTRPTSLDFQLRYTFCSRIQFFEVLEAIRYILDD